MAAQGIRVQDEQDELSPTEDSIVTPKKQTKTLPAPKRERASPNNFDQVKVYMITHQNTTAREIAAALSMSPSTANKGMQRVRRE
jgi:hypothetical protein